MSTMWVQSTGAALAADVHGVDLSQPMSDATFQKVAEAWGEHLVLRFSGQKLDDPTLMKFSARFGELAESAYVDLDSEPEEIWPGNTEKNETFYADIFEAYLDKAN